MLAPVVALLFALTACGSDEAANEVLPDEVATTTAPSTTAPSTTAPSTTAPTTTAAVVLTGSEYCMAAQAIVLLDQTFSGFGDPLVLAEYLDELTSLYGQALAAAPPEIAADLAIVEARVVEVDAIVAAADYQVSVMVDAVTDSVTDESDAAALAVRLYDEAECAQT